MARLVNFFKVLLPILFIGSNLFSKEDETPAYVIYANEIFRLASQQIKKELGLICQGSGGGMPYDVEMISLDFYLDQNVSIEQARKLEIQATERLVQIINSHEKIRPFLREYPFPASRAEVMISFYPPQNTNRSPSDVQLVFQAKGNIHYSAKSKIKPYNYQDLKVEPYEEALKIVQGNGIGQIVDTSSR